MQPERATRVVPKPREKKCVHPHHNDNSILRASFTFLGVWFFTGKENVAGKHE